MVATLTNTEIRRRMLQYFYERNKNATSSMGKRGSAVNIRDIKAELKKQHGLTQQEVQSNLTYLQSQGWVEEKHVEKQIRVGGGTVIPSVSNYFHITAAGIDKVEGPGEFTIAKFHGIKIEATGQNIITLGDGNKIDARFSDLGQTLVELRQAIIDSTAPEDQKIGFVADIDTVQSQLAKPEPNRNIVAAALESLQVAAAIDGCAGLVEKVGHLII